MREAHNNAKAVKSDDAQVPVHLWDERIFSPPLQKKQSKAMTVARDACLDRYRLNVLDDALWYLTYAHGRSWYKSFKGKVEGCRPIVDLGKWYAKGLTPRQVARRMTRAHGAEWWDQLEAPAGAFHAKATPKFKREVTRDLAAIGDILWRANHNDWFEYPAGSRLKFFRFAKKYRKLARDGVPVFFAEPGPQLLTPQRDMPDEQKAVLREKLQKVIKKRYMRPSKQKIASSMQYFAVPKGVVDGVVQDWRIVYHAGANGLNDCVWVPTFWMPTVHSLVRLLNEASFMED